MIKVTEIPAKEEFKPLLRVAAYCRVSTEEERQESSFSTQISYYNNLIQSRNDWKFVDIYADDGISGTKSSREEFDRMIDDCEKGLIDMIITKSVSRFARNTILLLQITRRLREIGVDVYFEENDIHTLDSQSEQYLTMSAIMAETESISISNNIKWSVDKYQKNGLQWRKKRILGYNLDLKVIEKEAKIIKDIFHYYLSGLGCYAIAKKLNNENILNANGNKFTKSHIERILSNETYIGDLLLKKYYTLDEMPGKCIKNKGEKPFYLVENNHTPIIDKETFNKVQQIKKEKFDHFCKNRESHKNNQIENIYCSCGHKMMKRKLRGIYYVYTCANKSEHGLNACKQKDIREEDLIKTLIDINMKKVERIVIKGMTMSIYLKNKKTMFKEIHPMTLKEAQQRGQEIRRRQHENS